MNTMNLTTTNSAPASSRKLTRSVRNSPYRITAPLTVKKSELKSCLPKMAATNCIITFLASDSMILANAAPMMKPSARSSMLPLIAKLLNSFHSLRMRRILP